MMNWKMIIGTAIWISWNFTDITENSRRASAWGISGALVLGAIGITLILYGGDRFSRKKKSVQT